MNHSSLPEQIDRSVLLGIRSSDFLVVGVSLLLALALSPLANAQIQIYPQCVGPVTANSAGSPTAFPDAASFGFEEPLLNGSPRDYFYFGTQTPPRNEWRAWTMYGLSGIALNGSPLTEFNPDAPEGTHVGFLEDTGKMETQHSFTAGTFRIILKGAQRDNGGTLDDQHLKLHVDGKLVANIRFESETYQEFVSRPFLVGSAGTLTVSIEGTQSAQMALIDELMIEPIAQWKDGATWGGCVPGPGTDVTIPQSVAVALNGLGNKANDVLVNGELLVANSNTRLIARSVHVSGDQSLFQAGTESTPLTEDFTLTLKGGSNDPKSLTAISGGTIDLHGAPRVSWTRLTSTIDTGDDIITLEVPVDWEVGDFIVITSSRHQKSTPAPYQDFADLAEIAEILGPDSLRLEQGVQFYHYGGDPQLYIAPDGQTWTLDQRAEVGLLTHNVKVEGNPASATSRIGGHIMIMRDDTTGAGAARLSNVELYRMGRVGELGRYPMHWHVLLGDAAGQYIKNCSIHQTYNRAVTVHGTDFVQVVGNVAYSNLGHAIFLEDGSEQENVIAGNLVLTTLKPDPEDAVLPSDHELEQPQNRCPASFWITNPLNYIYDNVAAGTEGTGFWFIFPETPTGLSQGHTGPGEYFEGREPLKTPLGQFDGNVAHSCGSAFDMNDSIHYQNPPAEDHSIDANVAWRPDPSTTPIFSNFTMYACVNGFYAGISDEPLVFEDLIHADNNENVRLASYHTIKNSLFVARTGNIPWSTSVNGRQDAYIGYDGAGTMDNCYYHGFDVGATGVIKAAGGATLHPNHIFRGSMFNHPSLPHVEFLDYATAALNPVYTDGQHGSNPRKWGQAMRDEDGSLWGFPGTTIIGNHPFIYPPTTPSLPIPTGTFAKLTPFRVGHLRVSHVGHIKANLPDMILTREQNGVHPAYVFENYFKTDNHLQQPVLVTDDFRYTLDWINGIPDANDTGEFKVTLDDVEVGDSVILRLVGVANVATSVVGANFVPNFQALENATTTSLYRSGADVWIKFAGFDNEDAIRFIW